MHLDALARANRTPRSMAAEGDPPHHRHFQLFAVDRMLSLEPRADREAVLKVLHDHVIAWRQLVGTFSAAEVGGDGAPQGEHR
jgi:hypothetical protein